MLRKIFYVPFALLVLSFCVYFVDLSSYANPYLADAEKLIGRSIKIGTVRLQLLPTPRLSVDDLCIGNVQDSKEPLIAKIASAKVVLSLFDLLKGNIVVKRVDFNSPVINLEKNKKGDGNWNFVINQPKSKNKAESEGVKANAAVAGFFIKNLNINDATITYVDQQQGARHSFTDLSISLDGASFLGPYKAHLKTKLNENPVDIEIHTQTLNLNGKTPVEIDFLINFNGQEILAKLQGNVDCLNEAFLGNFKANSVGLPLVIELPNQNIDLKKSVDAQGKIEITKDQIKMQEIAIKHPLAQISGALAYDIASTALNANLKLKHQNDSIDLECSSKDLKTFHYQLSSGSYQNIKKWFTENEKITAPIQAKGQLKIEDEKIGLEKTSFNLGKANAEVDLAFNTKTKKTNANFQTQNLGNWGDTLGHPLSFFGPAKISCSALPKKDGFSILAKAKFNKGNIIFDGDSGVENALLSGNLTLENFDFDGLMINLRSVIRAEKTKVDVAIQNIGIKSGKDLDLSAAGNLSLDLSTQVPHLSGSINANPLQLTSCQDADIRFMNAIYHPGIFQYQILQISKQQSRWSKNPIKLPLNSFTMVLEIKIPKITISEFMIDSLKSDMTLKSGKLEAPFSAQLYGGKLHGNFIIQSAREQNIALSANFDGVSIEKIKAASEHFKSGKAYGQIDLKTFGNSQHDWVAKLHGSADFSMKDGIVKGFDLQKIVAIVKNPKNMLDVGSMKNAFNGTGETPFSKASAKFKIEAGSATTSDLVIEAQEAQLKTEGQIDLLNWYMHFDGQVVATSLGGIPPLKFKIKGPLDKPDYHLDYKNLQKTLVEDTLGSVVSKVLGKKSKKSENTQGVNENSDAPKENAVEKPEKLVKNLLKGFLG